jgi:hypothetical protein
MMSDDPRLGRLFQRYREACPEVEPSASFLPALWQKIEARHTFWFIFQRLARTAMTACAALCLLLLVLNLVSGPQARLVAPSYMDALMADHTAEDTYYTEALRSAPPPSDPAAALER